MQVQNCVGFSKLVVVDRVHPDRVVMFLTAIVNPIFYSMG